jgi:cytochrome b561
MSSQKTLTKPRLTSAFKQLWSLHWIMAACFLILYTGGAFMSRLNDDISLKDYRIAS